MHNTPLALAILSVPVLFFIFVLTMAIVAFEIWMLVDVIKNPSLGNGEKALWVIGMFLVHPFVAIAYYLYSRYAQTSVSKAAKRKPAAKRTKKA